MIGDVMAAGADVYVTGDIDYHTAIDTMADGLAIVDAGHYGTEYIFAEAMEKELNEAFSALKTTCASVKNPYTVCKSGLQKSACIHEYVAGRNTIIRFGKMNCETHGCPKNRAAV